MCIKQNINRINIRACATPAVPKPIILPNKTRFLVLSANYAARQGNRFIGALQKPSFCSPSHKFKIKGS